MSTPLRSGVLDQNGPVLCQFCQRTHPRRMYVYHNGSRKYHICCDCLGVRSERPILKKKVETKREEPQRPVQLRQSVRNWVSGVVPSSMYYVTALHSGEEKNVVVAKYVSHRSTDQLLNRNMGIAQSFRGLFVGRKVRGRGDGGLKQWHRGCKRITIVYSI